MQFRRFAMVGIVNTLIDFAALNGLLWLFHCPVGWRVFGCNALAFILAASNSYVLNKRWTFGNQAATSLPEISLFFSLTLVGLLINSTVVYLWVSLAWQPLPASAVVWVNLGKVVATAASLIWNFCSYRWLFSGTRRLGTIPPSMDLKDESVSSFR